MVVEPIDVAGLLRFAFRRTIVAANAEDGLLKVQEIAGIPLDPAAFHAAVAEALAAGLIREPVVLPEGALQCHWRLQLTAAGVARAQTLIGP